MNLRLGIILEVFKGGPNFYSNESLGSRTPFRKTYQFWIWPIPSYLKEPPCAPRTQIQREDQKRNMNLRLGIILEVFKGGRQIYIQMKAQVLPFQNNISILNSANSFIP